MIRAWVLYETPEGELKFEERDGEAYDATSPSAWGLEAGHHIWMTFQKATFLEAFLEGTPIRKF